MSFWRNEIVVIGELTGDPESHVKGNGMLVCKFSIAIVDHCKGESTEQQEDTTFYVVEVWNNLAETCQQNLNKGSQVKVRGKMYMDTTGTPAVQNLLQAYQVAGYR